MNYALIIIEKTVRLILMTYLGGDKNVIIYSVKKGWDKYD